MFFVSKGNLFYVCSITKLHQIEGWAQDCSNIFLKPLFRGIFDPFVNNARFSHVAAQMKTEMYPNTALWRPKWWYKCIRIPSCGGPNDDRNVSEYRLVAAQMMIEMYLNTALKQPTVILRRVREYEGLAKSSVTNRLSSFYPRYISNCFTELEWCVE